MVGCGKLLFTDEFDKWLTSESLVITAYVQRGKETMYLVGGALLTAL
jgi:hypothetical protein